MTEPARNRRLVVQLGAVVAAERDRLVVSAKLKLRSKLTKRFGLLATTAVSPAKFSGPRRRVVLNTTGASGTRLVSAAGSTAAAAC
jgi:hypothetical protein